MDVLVVYWLSEQKVGLALAFDFTKILIKCPESISSFSNEVGYIIKTAWSP